MENKIQTHAEEMKNKKKLNFNNMSLQDFENEDSKKQTARLIFLERKQTNILKRISNNIAFFFWFFIITTLLSLVIFQAQIFP